MDESNTVPILIFLTYIPKKAINIKEAYTNGMVLCKPKNKSEINRLEMGIKNTIQRLVKPLLDNRAIEAIGVKLGGCGRNLDKTARRIRVITKTFLFIINKGDLSNIQNNSLFG